MDSVANELKGGKRSVLYRETGITVSHWRKFIDRLTRKMWDFDRVDVLIDFVYVSAIYEWAAKNWIDNIGDGTRGSSFGAFQAYEGMISKAFKDKPDLTDFLRIDEFRKVLTQSTRECFLARKDEELATRENVGPNRSAGSYSNQRRHNVPDYCSEVKETRLLYNRGINLIGKIQLSLEKAKIARKEPHLHGKVSPVWHLPNEVLCWILFCFEGAGEEGRGNRIQNWNDLIVNTGRGTKITFDFGEAAARRIYTFDKLNIPYKNFFITKGKWGELEEPSTLNYLNYNKFQFNETRITTLLKKQFKESDVKGYTARVRELESIFRSIPIENVGYLFIKIEKRLKQDNISRYFYDHLSTSTRAKLINILKYRLM